MPGIKKISRLDHPGHRQAEEALRHSETRFREIADLLPQPIYEADLNGLITFTNRAGFEHFGYSSGDLARGLSLVDMLVPGERELALRNMADILQGRPVHGNEYTALRMDGSTFPIIITSAPIMKEGLSDCGALFLTLPTVCAPRNICAGASSSSGSLPKRYTRFSG